MKIFHKKKSYNFYRIILFSLAINGIFNLTFAQSLPSRVASPINIKQIHSGHSLTDPLFANWPGQYVNLIGNINSIPSWQLFDIMVGKSTSPGSTLKGRWDNPPGYGAPDARLNINNWELLSITERVPLFLEGANSQQWYLDGIQEQKQYLSLFTNNAWTNGNNGSGAPTLLWTTWTHVDNSDGPWRQMLDIQGAEFERMQDYANLNRIAAAPPVYLIPGHKMMAKLYDDIQLNLVPGITNINQFFSDNIHVNELGAYAITMIHYATIFKKNPLGLPNNLATPNPITPIIPTPELATYLQNMVWNVINNYPRSGFVPTALSLDELEEKQVVLSEESKKNSSIKLYPNPANNLLFIEKNKKLIDFNFIIYNNNGAVIKNEKGQRNPINIEKLPTGYYFLEIDKKFFQFYKN